MTNQVLSVDMTTELRTDCWELVHRRCGRTVQVFSAIRTPINAAVRAPVWRTVFSWAGQEPLP